MLIEPKVLSTTQPSHEQPGRATATTVAAIDLKLKTIISDMANAANYDSAEVINTLERLGLSTATQFVKPLIGILHRTPDSPLRQLTAFQMQALYCSNERVQRNVLDELERDMREGHREASEVRTGIVKMLKAQIAARTAVAKEREARPANYSRDDYMRENARLNSMVVLYEEALERCAADADMEVNEFVANLLSPTEESTND